MKPAVALILILALGSTALAGTPAIASRQLEGSELAVRGTGFWGGLLCGAAIGTMAVTGAVIVGAATGGAALPFAVAAGFSVATHVAAGCALID